MNSLFRIRDGSIQLGRRDCGHLPGLRRLGFTLVELLVGISIVGVMAGMVLYALAGAQTDAKIARTRGTIEKINSIILQEWESYRYRAAKINISPDLLSPRPTTAGNPSITALSSREGARMRMIVLRDLMRMEMPDRWTDLLYPPVAYKAALFTQDADTSNDIAYYAGNAFAPQPAQPPGIRPVPPKWSVFRSELTQASASAHLRVDNPDPAVVFPPLGGVYTGGVVPLASRAFSPATHQRTFQNQGAETLYMIVAAANYGGGSALEMFGGNEVGDTDEDGLFEFLDAWGNPIRWIRWPSGYDSPLNSPYFVENNNGNSDVLDPLRTDWRWGDSRYTAKPWLLVPLIVSAGPDEVFDLAFDSSSVVTYATQLWTETSWTANVNGAGPYSYPDPYVGSYDRSTGAYTGAGLGTFTDYDLDGDNSTDNISNHSIILE